MLGAVFTERLELRPMAEADRAWFVPAFGDDDFMVFSGGAEAPRAAHARFDRVLALNHEISFAKQPVIERATGRVIGYCGVGTFVHRGQRRWEIGWRLIPGARGRGYATEAARALLRRAASEGESEVWAIIDPRNWPSKAVARKVGFVFRQRAIVEGFVDNLYLWTP